MALDGRGSRSAAFERSRRRRVATLRDPDVVREIEAAFRRGNERKQFRLVHYSIQDDHAHLIVEANG